MTTERRDCGKEGRRNRGYDEEREGLGNGGVKDEEGIGKGNWDR